MHTYMRAEASYPFPDGGVSGCGCFAEAIVAGLRVRGFHAADPEDVEFAHLIKCSSGQVRYEIMIGFDHDDQRTWEVSCPPTLGFLARLFGRSEDRELGDLLRAVHDTVLKDERVAKVRWHPRYGVRSRASSTPTDEA